MFGPVTSLLKELGQRLHEVTADDNPYGYLVQHLSMALQGGTQHLVLEARIFLNFSGTDVYHFSFLLCIVYFLFSLLSMLCIVYCLVLLYFVLHSMVLYCIHTVYCTSLLAMSGLIV